MLKILLPSLLVCLSFAPLVSTREKASEPEKPLTTEVSAIAEDTKQGVTVRINQLQIQRIGATVQLTKVAAPYESVVKPQNFNRTIALSVSKKGNGKTSGPIKLTLKNGTELNLFVNGNQQLMSAIANAKTMDGYDYTESWFVVPADVEFDQIFPVSVTYTCTDDEQKPVTFQFDEITP